MQQQDVHPSHSAADASFGQPIERNVNIKEES
jgi:hypothetical protein